MTTTLPMLLAAAGIGIGHAILPDHWMPLAVLARTRRYPTRRVVRLSAAAAATHVVVSAVLGVALLVIGLQFRDTVGRHADLAVGGVLVATGVVFGVMELLGRGHGHSHEHGGHGHAHAGHEHADADKHARNDHDHADADANADEHARNDHEHEPAYAGHGHAHTGHDHLHQHSHSHADHSHEGEQVAGIGSVAVLERPTVVTTKITAGATHTHEHDPERVDGAARTHEHDRERVDRAAHTHDHTGHDRPGPRGLLAILVPFGAAASPDLTILPVFLAAGALGVGASLAVLAAFTLATVATIVGLTTATSLGARRLTAPWIERRANLVTAATLILIGGLVVTGLI